MPTAPNVHSQTVIKKINKQPLSEIASSDPIVNS